MSARMSDMKRVLLRRQEPRAAMSGLCALCSCLRRNTEKAADDPQVRP